MASTSFMNKSEKIKLLNDLNESDSEGDSDFLGHNTDDDTILLDEKQGLSHSLQTGKGPRKTFAHKKDKTIGLEWQNYDSTAMHCTLQIFTGTPEINVPINNVYFLFNSFFTDKLFDTLVTQTNLMLNKFLTN